ncbi:MAG: hypothetical protein IJO45_04310 [Oscillospiraceae bacterium]|nr:hypothetical protein [Oscillospiraceae bacterium]
MDEIKRLKRVNYLALAVVVAFAAACVLGALALRERHRFSREKWLQDPENRTRIVDDLLAHYELVGMTGEEVLALLGDHDNEAGYFQQEERLDYWLGPERGLMRIDSEWLILDFADEVVTGWFITTD